MHLLLFTLAQGAGSTASFTLPPLLGARVSETGELRFSRGGSLAPLFLSPSPLAPSLLFSFCSARCVRDCEKAFSEPPRRDLKKSVWRKVCRLLLALQRGQRRAPSLQHRWSKRQQQTYHQVIIPTLRAPDILPSSLSLTKCEPRIKLEDFCSDADTDITRRKTADCEFPENLSK